MRFFGTALLIAWTFLHFYVFGRAWTVPAIRRRVPRQALLGGAAALWSTFVLSRFAGHDASRAGVGLMLSGHTHGGQIWPFGYLVRFAYPLVAGRYEIGEMTVLVSRGAGTWGPRLRLWLPGEILRVTLRGAV